MLTHVDLLAHLRALPHAEVDASRDYRNSVSNKVIRCRYDGRRAVAVGADSKTKVQITALLDLLDLHLQSPGDSPDGVALVLGGVAPGTEALDALGSLICQLRGQIDVRVYVADSTARLQDVPTRCFYASDETQYPRWRELLLGVAARPPALLCEVLQHAARPELVHIPCCRAPASGHSGSKDWRSVASATAGAR